MQKREDNTFHIVSYFLLLTYLLHINLLITPNESQCIFKARVIPSYHTTPHE